MSEKTIPVLRVLVRKLALMAVPQLFSTFTKIILDGMTEYHYIIAKMKEKKTHCLAEGRD